MIEFRDISLSDKERCRKIFQKSGSMSCDRTFGNLFTWKDVFGYKICFAEGFLFIRGGKDKYWYFFPLGDGDIATAIGILKKQAGDELRLLGVTSDEADKLRQSEVKIKKCELSRDNSDYIYKVCDLTLLSGKKYHSKRNFISRFESEYNWSYESINADNIYQCVDICEKWFEENPYEIDAESEKKSVYCTFENYRELGFTGGMLKVDGKPVAFTLGEPINDNTFCIHIEKALTEYVGAYPMINRQFLAESCSEYEYVNREEDMGLEGLRKAKDSYHPAFLCEKYDIII